MPAMKITKKSVDATKPTPREQFLWDAEIKRFGLRVKPSGVKSYMVQYRNAQGRSRKLTIGQHGPWTPEKAREEAKRLLRIVDQGGDPAEAREEEKQAITVAELCEEYFQKARRGHPYTLTRSGRPIKASTLDTDEGRCNRHVIPLLGRKLAGNVTPDDIVKFIEGVTEGKTAGVFKSEKPRGKAVVKGGEGAARRTVARLSAMLSYAVKAKHCATNPCRDVPRTADKRKNIRLSREEYHALGRAIGNAESRGAHWQFCAIARLIALTGLRRNEAIKLRTAEVDFVNRCIRLADSKTGASIRPLGEAAHRLLRSIVRAGETYIFPGVIDAGTPYGAFPKGWKAYIDDALTPHGLRHGYASAAFEVGCSETIVAHLLGHATARTTTQGYIRAPEKMVLDAADKVAGYIDRAMRDESADVVSLATQAREREHA
jgi:integrase